MDDKPWRKPVDDKPLTDREKWLQAEGLLREMGRDCTRMHGDVHDLLAENTALRERMRWRDAAKELPDEYEDVIVEHVEEVGEAYMVRELDGSPLWYRNDYRLKSVTRWTYMPAAPEVPQ
jgi:hypothetical protein